MSSSTMADIEVAKPVDLRALLIDLAGGRAVVTASPEPLIVTASEDRLAQAFANILENAISFSPVDGQVEVSMFERDGWAVVRVDDEGPGIPPEHLDRIFDRFFSFRPADQRNHDGLGLAIAHAVVNGYGGSIRAENLAPGGARIEVRLPLSRT